MNAFEVLRVRNGQVDQIVRISGHQTARHYLGAGGDGIFEVSEDLHGLAGERNLHENVESPVDLLGIQDGYITLDHSNLLKRFHSAMASRCRKSHLLGQLNSGGSSVGLQLSEDQAIDVI